MRAGAILAIYSKLAAKPHKHLRKSTKPAIMSAFALIDKPQLCLPHLMTITLKDQHDIEKMRIAGQLAAEVLDYLAQHVKAGITTAALDKLAHDYMTEVQGTIPAPLNYAPPGYKPFPKSICTSVNHQVCHGIPGEKALKSGDVVNIDVTVIKDGYHGDTSRMFYVGAPSIAG